MINGHPIFDLYKYDSLLCNLSFNELNTFVAQGYTFMPVPPAAEK